MLKESEIAKTIKEMDKIINYIIILSTLIIICLIICFIEHI